MFPHERSLVKKMEGKPFALIGVNSDRDKARITAGLKQHQITWRSFWCGPEGQGGKIPRQFKVQGWPTLLLIDHHGVIRNKWVGSPGDKVLDREIEKLVKEAEGEKNKS
jgi:hypothetical protein